VWQSRLENARYNYFYKELNGIASRNNLSSIYILTGKMPFKRSSSTLLLIDTEKAFQVNPSAAAEGVAGNEIWVDF